MRRRLKVAALLCVTALSGCAEQAMEPRVADDPAAGSPPRELAFTVSEPVRISLPGLHAGAMVDERAAYVSLDPGTIPGSASVLISNQRTGYQHEYALVDGGLDPVAVPAAVGDTIRLEAHAGGDVIAGLRVVAPETRARIIRTRPSEKKRDVPLNAVIEVVFSEPMLDPTLGDSAVQLLLDDAPVDAVARFQNASRTIVEITPLQPLRALTEYRLVVTRAARDLSGDEVEDGIEISFTTAAVPVPLLLRSVSAGAEHTCGITLEGGTVCWGATVESLTPQRLDAAAFDGIAAGGTAICGFADYVQCVAGDERLMGRWPSGGTGIFDVDFSVMSTGGDHACGLLELGGVRCWGRYRMSGNTEFYLYRPRPVGADSVLVALASGAEHDCGITASGQAYCWGFDNAAQLGAEGIRFSSFDGGPGDTIPIFALRVETELRFAVIGAGGDTSCGVTPGGELYCWGNDISPTPGFTTRPARIPGADGLTAITIGHEHICALDAAGSARCWGSGDDGQGGVVAIGDGPGAQIWGLAFRSLSAGSHHTCGIATDDTVWCWGLNGSGQLGDGTTLPRAVPVRVTWNP